MAKGTLAASATATKKGSVSTRGGSKNGKSSIVGSQEGSSTSTTAAASKGSKKAKTAAAAPANKKKAVAAAPAKPAVSDESADDDDEVVFVERDSKDGAGPRHLDPKGKKYDKHYKAVVRDALGGMDLLYADEQDKVETILKLFDLEPEYGPAAGMTRLERWKRAANWGLDPPAEVYDILTTIEGGSKDKYRESLYYGRV